MEIVVKRVARKSLYTISHFTIDGQYIGDIIEDKDRGLKQSMKLSEILELKVKDKTAIPAGRYQVTLKVRSPKFGSKAYYNNYCKGYLPRLLNVPGFDGILMHRGVDQNSSSGCLILGKNTVIGKVTDSKEIFEKAYKLMKKASDKGEEIWITIS